MNKVGLTGFVILLPDLAAYFLNWNEYWNWNGASGVRKN